jgi:hypothetical protein
LGISRFRKKFRSKNFEISKYRKTPYLVPGTILVFKNFFYEGSTRYQMQPENLQEFFRSKNKVFGPVQIPEKKLFLNFVLRLLGDFVPKSKNKVLFGFSTGTKDELRIFEE